MLYNIPLESSFFILEAMELWVYEGVKHIGKLIGFDFVFCKSEVTTMRQVALCDPQST